MESQELMCLLLFASIVIIVVVLVNELQRRKESAIEDFPLNMYMLLDLAATIKDDKKDKPLFEIIVEDIFNINLKRNGITDSNLYELKKEFIGPCNSTNKLTNRVIRAVLEMEEDEFTVSNIKEMLRCFRDKLETESIGNIYLENNKIKYQRYVD